MDYIYLYFVFLLFDYSNSDSNNDKKVKIGFENNSLLLNCYDMPLGAPDVGTYQWKKITDNSEIVLLNVIKVRDRVEVKFLEDWQNRNMKFHKNNSVFIPELQMSDNDEYKCTMGGNGLQIPPEDSEVDFTLLVYVVPEPPVIHISEDIYENKLSLLTCQSSRVNPSNATVYWYLKQRDINQDGKMRATSPDNKGTISITNTLRYKFNRTDHDTIISCLIKPGYHDSSPIASEKTLKIHFTYNTIVIDKDEAEHPILGESKELYCQDKMMGFPASVTGYRWWHNDSKILITNTHFSQSDTNTLKIDSLGFRQAGSYECQIENKAGWSKRDMSTPYQLTVWYAPVITKIESIPEIVNDGDDVNLLCTFHSFPFDDIEYKWYFNDENIAGTNGLPKLILKKIIYKDSGKYQCSICNLVSCSKSDPLLLNVNHAPVGHPSAKSDSEQYKIGEDITMRCNTSTLLTHGLPIEPFYVIWKKKEDPNFSMNVSSKLDLTITADSFLKSGKYECYYGNKYGNSSASSPWDISLQADLFAEIPSTKVTYKYPIYDRAFEIECAFSGSNIQKIRWFKDDQEVTSVDDDFIQGTKHIEGNFSHHQTLATSSMLKWNLKKIGSTCEDVNQFDGSYNCKADGIAKQSRNTAVSSSYKVRTNYPALWDGERNRLFTSAIGQKNVVIECKVCSNPSVKSYHFTREDGKELRDGIQFNTEENSLTIGEVTSADFNTYLCQTVVLSNDSEIIINSTFAIKLEERGPPYKPIDVYVLSNITSVSLTITWQPQNNAGYAQYFTIYCKSANASESVCVDNILDDETLRTSMRYTLSKLQSDTIYEFGIGATNSRPPTDGPNTSNVTWVTAKTAEKPNITLTSVIISEDQMIVRWDFPFINDKRKKRSIDESQIRILILYKLKDSDHDDKYPDDGTTILATKKKVTINGLFFPDKVYVVKIDVYENGINTFTISPFIIEPEPKSDYLLIAIAGGVGAVILIFIIIVTLFIFKFRKAKSNLDDKELKLSRGAYQEIPDVLITGNYAAFNEGSFPYNNPKKSHEPSGPYSIAADHEKPPRPRTGIYDNVNNTEYTPTTNAADIVIYDNMPGLENPYVNTNQTGSSCNSFQDDTYEDVSAQQPTRHVGTDGILYMELEFDRKRQSSVPSRSKIVKPAVKEDYEPVTYADIDFVKTELYNYKMNSHDALAPRESDC